MAIYFPLDRDRKEIRVATVLPSNSPSDEVQCELKTVSLLDSPIYEALSYVWGDPTDTRVITLSGLSKNVTANLDAALRVFRCRAAGRPFRLWIDAICINQEEEEDKRHQVQIMGEIYSKAVHVRAWLGLSVNPMVTRGFLRLVYLVRSRPQTWHAAHRPLSPERPAKVQPVGAGQGECGLYDLNRCIQLASEEISAIADFCDMPYWRRRWISQELALARSLSLFYGHAKLHIPSPALLSELIGRLWDDSTSIKISKMMEAASSVGQFDRKHPRLTEDGMLGTISMIYVRIRWKPLFVSQSMRTRGLQKSLLRLVFREMKYYEAAKPHDHVYGILGLLPGDLSLVVRYDVHPDDLFEEFTVKFVQHFRTLCPLYEANASVSALPSWVPSWKPDGRFIFNQRREMGILDLAKANLGLREAIDSLRPHLFDASKGTSFVMSHPGARTISVSAVSFDRLDVLIQGEPLPLTQLGSVDAFVMAKVTTRNYVDSCMRALEYFSPMQEKTSKAEIYRTMLMDMSLSAHPTRMDPGEIASLEQIFQSAMETNMTGGQPDHTLSLKVSAFHYQFCISRKGYIGMVPRTARQGDHICIISSLELPVCLRKVEHKGEDVYTLVGRCYINGIMDGEFVEAEALRRFGDVSRVDEVFSPIFIV